MKAKNFELFMCCLGNGTTVCNKAVMEHNDYKYIAHISNAGNIKLYVDEDYIPAEDMKRIKAYADKCACDFHNNFEKQDIKQQYYKILDKFEDDLSIKEYLKFIQDKRPLEEKVSEWRAKFYQLS